MPEFHGIIESVDILGYDGRLQWSVDGEGLHVTAPGIDSEFLVVVRVRPAHSDHCCLPVNGYRKHHL